MPVQSIRGAMLSHVGAVRSNNEDRVAYILPKAGDPAALQGALFLVADGMGGHAAGELASQIAAATVCRHYYTEDGSVPDVLAKCFSEANNAIRLQSIVEPEYAGMGTTCTAIAVRDGLAYLGHVGDSRAYIRRDGALHQVSPDHTLVAQLVRDGSLTQEEANVHPDRNVIIKALGTRAEVEPTIWSDGLRLRAGDILVLCSDGLSDMVDSAQIDAAIVSASPLDACEALIDAALKAGGYDNVSVGVFVFEPESQEVLRPDRATRKIEAAPLADPLA
jgi:serine/threonine protein phosphatase PrpC